ncbi:NAD(P)/FAD-dependent oxidoreductase [Azospirillum sp.]|uniref:NAD(P)/FAD-dependent oxidoreductase n=1 Tax=Azospirillum sp. TaxID=34012 RepID=UPI002D292204|nr:NAD(P)/FAD-dependent oxidoreductase [Azospirillum sp.]HYD69919.1 NAD(P)/FAD-dependent oxidoreductase [Azospirillum sp.]
MNRLPSLTRRSLLTAAGAGAGLSLFRPAASRAATTGAAKARVVVVGGGFGGATAAKTIRRLDPAIEVTLVEPSREFVTCPFSNLVLGGLRDLPSITHRYDALSQKHGVKVVHAAATGVDPAARTVTVSGGLTLPYDRLILSPGIDIRWNAVPGYDEPAADVLPHAWKAGAQTALLRRQLQALEDGGLVIIAAPANPFRCPPGPYERASLIAQYLKTHKPRSKLLILDAKDAFSKQGLFTDAWTKLYPGLIEWVPASRDGKVVSVEPKEKVLVSEFGERHKGAVVNVIPPQKAGAIADAAGVTDDKGWAPVDHRTFESRKVPGIHVVGDACIPGAMPKSAFCATAQAKVAAAAVVAALNGTSLPDPQFINTCYSLIGDGYGISVAGVYRVNAQGVAEEVPNSGGVSPKDADAEFRRKEALYGEGWYRAITADTFG